MNNSFIKHLFKNHLPETIYEQNDSVSVKENTCPTKSSVLSASLCADFKPAIPALPLVTSLLISKLFQGISYINRYANSITAKSNDKNVFPPRGENEKLGRGWEEKEF